MEKVTRLRLLCILSEAVSVGCSNSGTGALFWDGNAATGMLAGGGSVCLSAVTEAAVLTGAAILANCAI